ncbi:UNVERIFIED_CONTAM: rhomboid protease ROM5 [Hammondia hammondi]|eukprot:XP_008886799.1 rhomboid protease ROM5 [Hammondia hammondi]
MSSKRGSSQPSSSSKDMKKVVSRAQLELRDTGRVRGEVEKVEKRLRVTTKVKEQPPAGECKRRAIASPGETSRATPTFLVDSRGIPRKTASTAPRKAPSRPASSSPRLASSSRLTESTPPLSSSRALHGASSVSSSSSSRGGEALASSSASLSSSSSSRGGEAPASSSASLSSSSSSRGVRAPDSSRELHGVSSSSSSSRTRRLRETASGRGGSGGSAVELGQEEERLPKLEAVQVAPVSCVVQLRDMATRKRPTSPATPPETAGSSVCGQRSHARTAEKLEEGADACGDSSRCWSVDAETRATEGDRSSAHEFESSPQREERMQTEETGRRKLSSEPRSGGLTKNGGDGGPRKRSCVLGKWREQFWKQSFEIAIHPFPARGRGSPRRGRFLMTFLTSAILFFVYFQELVLNVTTFNGRCMSPVLYPSYEAPASERTPRVISFGYGACEHNLGVSLFRRDETKKDPRGQWSPGPLTERCASGRCASDDGWPADLVQRGRAQRSPAAFDSPNPRVFNSLGALDTNKVRNYGEVFRVVWGMFLHGGWLHLLLNVACQAQTLWILEPSWGFLRTLLLWLVGGISGSLLSAVANPCTVTVGSSGAFYGLLGALVPFSIEYWDHIASPAWFLVSVSFLVIVAQFGNMIGVKGIDNNAHLGGLIGGLLFGFATIRSVHAFRWQGVAERMASSTLFWWMFPAERRRVLREANLQRVSRERQERSSGRIPRPKFVWKLRGHEREWCVRFAAAVGLVTFWSVLWLYLLVPSYYESLSSPPGNFSFSGSSGCHCCRVQPFPGEEDKLPTLHPVRVNRGLFWCFVSEGVANLFCGRSPSLRSGADGNGQTPRVPEVPLDLPTDLDGESPLRIAKEGDSAGTWQRLVKSAKKTYNALLGDDAKHAAPSADVSAQQTRSGN